MCSVPEKDVRTTSGSSDNYVIQTFTENIWENWKEVNEYADFSGYNKNNQCYDVTNKQILGKFKHEMGG